MKRLWLVILSAMALVSSACNSAPAPEKQQTVATPPPPPPVKDDKALLLTKDLQTADGSAESSSR